MMAVKVALIWSICLQVLINSSLAILKWFSNSHSSWTHLDEDIKVGISTPWKAWYCWLIRSIIGGKVNYLEVGPGPGFLVQSFPASHYCVGTEIKFKYQPQVKKFGVVEESELNSSIMSRWRRHRSRTKSRSLSFVGLITVNYTIVALNFFYELTKYWNWIWSDFSIN